MIQVVTLQITTIIMNSLKVSQKYIPQGLQTFTSSMTERIS